MTVQWDDEDLFQAILLEKNRVLLTTYSQHRSEWPPPTNETQAPEGTMWDYSPKVLRQMWIAEARKVPADTVEQNITNMRPTKWLGKRCYVCDPESVHFLKVSAVCRKAYLKTNKWPNGHKYSTTAVGVVRQKEALRGVEHCGGDIGHRRPERLRGQARNEGRPGLGEHPHMHG